MTHEEKQNLWMIFRASGKDAITANQYQLEEMCSAVGTPISADVWAEFLQEPDVRKYVQKQVEGIARAAINNLINDAGSSNSVGKSQLISTLAKLIHDDEEPEGPVFIYTYVPPSEMEQLAENVKRPEENEVQNDTQTETLSDTGCTVPYKEALDSLLQRAEDRKDADRPVHRKTAWLDEI